MKVLVTGANGQLGSTLAAAPPDSVSLVAFRSNELDVTDGDAVAEKIAAERPDVIVNAAAYTAVDKAEEEPDIAMAVNSDGARNLALAAREIGARLIQISTDFVFDGKAAMPYGVDAAPGPLGAYGRSKLAGEKQVLDVLPDATVVLRTSWLYSATGHNFVNTMLRLISERDDISVVADQVGSPTWTASVAEAVFALVDSPDCLGIFHWSDAGQASWHEFATAIRDEAYGLGIIDRMTTIHAIPSSGYPQPAKRPAFSVLDTRRAAEVLGLTPKPWRQKLRQMLETRGLS